MAALLLCGEHESNVRLQRSKGSLVVQLHTYIRRIKLPSVKKQLPNVSSRFVNEL